MSLLDRDESSNGPNALVPLKGPTQLTQNLILLQGLATHPKSLRMKVWGRSSVRKSACIALRARAKRSAPTGAVFVA